MMIVGGKSTATFKDTTGYLKTISLVLPDGRMCTDTSLPEFDIPLEGFGLASRKNRYVYMCGGIKRSPTPSTYERSWIIHFILNHY